MSSNTCSSCSFVPRWKYLLRNMWWHTMFNRIYPKGLVLRMLEFLAGKLRKASVIQRVIVVDSRQNLHASILMDKANFAYWHTLIRLYWEWCWDRAFADWLVPLLSLRNAISFQQAEPIFFLCFLSFSHTRVPFINLCKRQFATDSCSVCLCWNLFKTFSGKKGKGGRSDHPFLMSVCGGFCGGVQKSFS